MCVCIVVMIYYNLGMSENDLLRRVMIYNNLGISSNNLLQSWHVCLVYPQGLTALLICAYWDVAVHTDLAPWV